MRALTFAELRAIRRDAVKPPFFSVLDVPKAKPRRAEANPVPRVPHVHQLAPSGLKWWQEVAAWGLAVAIAGGFTAGFIGLAGWLADHL